MFRTSTIWVQTLLSILFFGCFQQIAYAVHETLPIYAYDGFGETDEAISVDGVNVAYGDVGIPGELQNEKGKPIRFILKNFGIHFFVPADFETSEPLRTASLHPTWTDADCSFHVVSSKPLYLQGTSDSTYVIDANCKSNPDIQRFI